MTFTADPDELIMTMQRIAVLLKQEGVPFALAGSMAVWAHGGIGTEHDVDFLIRYQDVPRVLDAARAAGLAVVQPPEDWLVKLYDDDRLIDLIYRPVEQAVTDELLARCPVMRVHAVAMPVLPATELMVHKLLALSEHNCDFSRVLPTCRSLREQVDWAQVAARTAGSPFAAALLYLLHLLGISPGPGRPGAVPGGSGPGEPEPRAAAEGSAPPGGPAGSAPPGRAVGSAPPGRAVGSAPPVPGGRVTDVERSSGDERWVHAG